MADWKDPQSTRQGFGVSPSLTGELAGRTTVDAGLRRHMLSIYNYMASGVLLSGIIALVFATNEALLSTLYTVQNTVQTDYGRNGYAQVQVSGSLRDHQLQQIGH